MRTVHDTKDWHPGVAIAVCASGPTAGAQQTTWLPTGTSQVWHGVEPDSFAGRSLAQGVVGGNDAQRDLIVGVPGVSLPAPYCDPLSEALCIGPPSVGRVHILFGGVERTGSFDLTVADVTISGNLGEGTYWVQAWVRTVGSGAEYEAWANSAVLVIE